MIWSCISFVLCLHTPALSSDSVRLISDTNTCSGMLAVKSSGLWFPVCENHLTQQNAEVLCRELRCGPPSSQHLALLGNPGQEVGAQNIRCQGSESVLLDCQWLTAAREECSPAKSVTLSCSGTARVVVDLCLGILLPRTDFLFQKPSD